MSECLNPGEAVMLRFKNSNPPKNKICLCICIETGTFLIISSKPYTAAPADSQIRIFKEELTILEHDSYLDVSKYYDDFTEEDIRKGVAYGVHALSKSARDKIKHAVAGQRNLIKRVKNMILNNL